MNGLPTTSKVATDELAGGIASEPRRHRAREMDGQQETQPLRRDTGTAAALRLVCRPLQAVIRSNAGGVASCRDDESLHDFRVAVRRTRAALTQIRGALPEAEAARYRRDFAWLGRLTGPARDLEVLRRRLHEYHGAAAPGEETEAVQALVACRLRQERERIARALGKSRFPRLMGDWSCMLQLDADPREAPASASRPIAGVARQRVAAAFAKVIERADRAERAGSAEPLHSLRIACKKLRYLLEFFRPLADPEAVEATISSLKSLQDLLGDLQDRAVHAAILRRLSPEGDSESGHPDTVALARRAEWFHEQLRSQARPAIEVFVAAANQRAVQHLLDSIECTDVTP